MFWSQNREVSNEEEGGRETGLLREKIKETEPGTRLRCRESFEMNQISCGCVWIWASSSGEVEECCWVKRSRGRVVVVVAADHEDERHRDSCNPKSLHSQPFL